MNNAQTIRAWKEPSFRKSLNETQRAALPANPAGLVEMNDAELMETGGGTTIVCVTVVTIILAFPSKAY